MRQKSSHIYYTECQDIIKNTEEENYKLKIKVKKIHDQTKKNGSNQEQPRKTKNDPDQPISIDKNQ